LKPAIMTLRSASIAEILGQNHPAESIRIER
jgi:hypothetical protein